MGIVGESGNKTTHGDEKMTRTEEQIEAIAELTSREIADLRYLESLAGDFAGMDSITVDSCWQNGRDTCADLGIVEGDGFSWVEVENAAARHAISTARLYEVI